MPGGKGKYCYLKSRCYFASGLNFEAGGSREGMLKKPEGPTQPPETDTRSRTRNEIRLPGEEKSDNKPAIKARAR